VEDNLSVRTTSVVTLKEKDCEMDAHQKIRMNLTKKTCMDNSRNLRKRRTNFNKQVRIEL
jgi:hypothetical protein